MPVAALAAIISVMPSTPLAAEIRPAHTAHHQKEARPDGGIPAREDAAEVRQVHSRPLYAQRVGRHREHLHPRGLPS